MLDEAALEATAVLLGIIGFERVGVGLHAQGFNDPAVGEEALLEDWQFFGSLLDGMIEIDNIVGSIAICTFH